MTTERGCADPITLILCAIGAFSLLMALGIGIDRWIHPPCDQAVQHCIGQEEKQPTQEPTK